MNCKHCGKAFEQKASGRKSSYCSKLCRHRDQHNHKPRYELHCRQCGRNYESTNKHSIYCGVECRRLSTRKNKGVIVTCVECGTTFERKHRNNKLCSIKCVSLYNADILRVYKDKIEERKARSKREKERRKVDPSFVIKNRMRCRIYMALKHGKGGKSWRELFGYSARDLKQHIEKQFKKGMNWNEFLKGNIHIDHKIPVSAFNFNSIDDIDFKRCWSLNNLRPMWARDNISKGDKLLNHFQPSLLIG